MEPFTKLGIRELRAAHHVGIAWESVANSGDDVRIGTADSRW